MQIHQISSFETVSHHMTKFRTNRSAIRYLKDQLFRGVHLPHNALLGQTPVLNVLYIFPLNWPDAMCHNFAPGLINEERFGGLIDFT